MEEFQRSHAQTEDHQGSASPAWSPQPHDLTRDSRAHLHPFYATEQRAPANDHASALRFHLRSINPFAPTHTHVERPGSAGPEHPSTSALPLPPLHQIQHQDMASSAPRRFVGDGFDFRRPARGAREHEATPADLSGDDDDDDYYDDDDDDDDDDDMHIDLSRDEDVIDLTADDSGYGASQDGNGGEQRHGNGQRHPRQSTQDHQHGSRRLPRGMDIIIDLDNGEEEWRMATPPPAEPGSPDIEFISSRTIDPPRRGVQTVFGRTVSDGDEVEFVRANALPEAEIQRRRDQEMDRVLDLVGDMNGHFTHLRAQVARFNDQVNRTAANFRRPPVIPPRGAPRARGHVHVGFAAPGPLDFHLVAFDMGIEPPQAPPPPPTYQAPPAASEGFTRSPEEEGPLICPNCEEELCVGEDEVKRQVWIVKSCGHVS
jgi:hypothetical protein